MRAEIAVIAAVALLAGCGCPGTSGTRPSSAHDAAAEPAVDPRCLAVRDRVEQLYRNEAGADKPELAADLLDANVTMAMTDCRRQPARVAPCLERAQSAGEIESDCLIPLDDEGMVEAQQFTGSRRDR